MSPRREKHDSKKKKTIMWLYVLHVARCTRDRTGNIVRRVARCRLTKSRCAVRSPGILGPTNAPAGRPLTQNPTALLPSIATNRSGPTTPRPKCSKSLADKTYCTWLPSLVPTAYPIRPEKNNNKEETHRAPLFGGQQKKHIGSECRDSKIATAAGGGTSSSCAKPRDPAVPLKRKQILQ